VAHPVIKTVSLIPRFEYLGRRSADTEGSAILDGYFLAHLKVSVEIGKYISVSAGIENIFDTLYEIKQYFPMAGRAFSFSVEGKY
jgi:iron complex outermembrane receptor protein